MRMEKDPSGHVRRMIIDHKGELHPQIVLEDADGKPLDVYYLPERAHIEVAEGEQVHGRLGAGQDAARSVRHHATSRAVCRA